MTAVYPLGLVHNARNELARRKPLGKIVLALDPTITEPTQPSTSTREN